MQLSVDYSIIIQIVLFLILWFVLKKILFDPVMQVLDQREQRTTGARVHASALTEQANTTRSQTDHTVREARVEIAAEMERSRQDASEEQAAVLKEARARANAELERLRHSFAEQTEQARLGLAAESEAIASAMLARVSRRIAS